MSHDEIRVLAERTLARVNEAMTGGEAEVDLLSEKLVLLGELAPRFSQSLDPHCADRISALTAGAAQTLLSLSARYAKAAGVLRCGDDEAAAMLAGATPPSAATPPSTAKH